MVHKFTSGLHSNYYKFIFSFGYFFLVQDIMNKRNPRLVPYNLLDEKTKKTNRDTVCAAVRTLIGYGYNIEPPDQESSKFTCCFYHVVDLLFESRCISLSYKFSMI